MSVEFLETRAFKYELSIEINAPPPEVWTALIEETDAWWLPDFHMLGTGSTVTLRAEAGGALIETHADGGSLLWYTVQMVSPGESLHLAGHLAPEWGWSGHHAPEPRDPGARWRHDTHPARCSLRSDLGGDDRPAPRRLDAAPRRGPPTTSRTDLISAQKTSRRFYHWNDLRSNRQHRMAPAPR